MQPNQEEDFEIMQKQLARLENPYMMLRLGDVTSMEQARQRADQCTKECEAMQLRRASRDRRKGLPCCLVVADERALGVQGRRR